MTDRGRFLTLILIMVVVSAGVAMSTIVFLYDAYFEQQRERLIELSQSQARLIEAVAAFDSQYSGQDVSGGAVAATLSQIRDAHKNYTGFGETGEFVLARLKNGMMEFLVSHRADGLESPDPIPFDQEMAEPMRRALSGMSGTVIGPDYRGETVLAAYEPVAVLNMGIVTKIDLAEVRSPFLRAVTLMGAIATVLVIIGAFLFRRISNPLISRLETAVTDLEDRRDEQERIIEARTSELTIKTELLKAILNSMTQGIVAFDKDLRLIAFNEKFREVRGYPIELLEEGREFSEFMQYDVENEEFGSGDPEKILNDKIKTAKQFLSHEFERQRPDGRSIEVRGGPLPGGGFVSTYADVTERKEAAARLETQVSELNDARKATLNMMADAETLRIRAEALRDEAEAATQAKAAFLATMSHEIRTPMNGVIGMVDMLVQTKLEEDQRQMLNTVRDSAYALLTIINDILDFSKIEAGKLDLEQIPFSVRDALEGVSETLASNARKKHIRLNIHVDPDIPDALLGDQVRLRQILFNMGGNAIKFTEEGRVLIRARLVPTKDDTKTTVRFEITDSGIGISKEAQADLFTEFSQAESSTTRRFGGTGLGLSICQRLTEMMDGKIEVKSELGEGSTFIVTLSFPVPEKHEIKSDGHDLSGLNILFVGDDADERELDAKYLRHWTAEVATVGEFENVKSLALEAAKGERPYDIIVLSSAWPR